MRAIQKVIIIVYGLLVAVACIYVPWVSLYVPSGAPVSEIHMGLPLSLGYSLLWKPLSDFPKNIPNLSTVDIQRVILELIAITAVFAIFFVLTLRSKKALP